MKVEMRLRIWNAAEWSSTTVLNVVGAIFLMTNMRAWIGGHSITISGTHPIFLQMLGVWVVIFLALLISPIRKT